MTQRLARPMNENFGTVCICSRSLKVTCDRPKVILYFVTMGIEFENSHDRIITSDDMPVIVQTTVISPTPELITMS